MKICDVEECGTKELINNDKKIDHYLKLKENGYLKSLDAILMFDYKFELTEKGKNYINPK